MITGSDLWNGPKFPKVKVHLVGEDGNAFAIIGRVRKALDDADGPTREDIQAFVKEATSSDYDHVLATCMAYVTVL